MKIPSLREVIVPFETPGEAMEAVQTQERFSFVKYDGPKVTENGPRLLDDGSKVVDYTVVYNPVKVEGVIAKSYRYDHDDKVLHLLVQGKSYYLGYSEQWKLRYDFKTEKWTIKDVYQ